MSSRPTFTILCCVQIFIGFTMILLGIGDRVTVAAQCSYLMLPIWIGALAGFVGCYGLIIGHQNRRFHNRNAERQGFHNRDAGSAIKAINISCVGLSFLVLYLYGTVLSFIGFNNDKFGSIVGIFSTAVIMCFAEMFVGCWLAIIDRNQMVCGSSVQLGRQGYGVVRNMNIPSNQENLPGNQTQPSQYVQQGYGVAQGNNMNFPSNQAYNVPGNQMQQSQEYVQQRTAPLQTQPAMVVPSIQNMLSSNQNVLPGNENMSPSNRNVMPGNRKLDNQDMTPSNQNTFPSNHNVVLSNQNAMLPSVQSEQTEGGATRANQDLIESQEDKSIKRDSDETMLL